MTTSFRKATRVKAPDILGTRISVENSQLLVSTGAPDFDSVIGGGLAVGTLLVIFEDPTGSYAKLLAKLFLAEGIVVGHPMFVASCDLDPKHLVQEIPPPVSTTDREIPQATQMMSADESDLKIAWRYKNLSTGGESLRSSTIQFGHNFDLSHKIDFDVIQRSKPTFWRYNLHNENQGCETHPCSNFPACYTSLLEAVKQVISENRCWVSGPAKIGEQRPSTVLRMVLHSVGSPLWPEGQKSLPALLFALRAIVRASCAVCLITLPVQLLEEAVLSRCCRLSDYCIQPSPAHHVDGKVPSLLSGMDGVFRILHLAPINSLTPFKPPTLDLGFKVRRKRFLIEKLQLPPEVVESAEREQDDIGAPTGNSLGCVSAQNKKLDF